MRLRLLLDENLSPSLVSRLAEAGVYALSVPHTGLAGDDDESVWSYAQEREFTVVTVNAIDFLRLLEVELHAGLIVLREANLSRNEQWLRLEAVTSHVLASGDPDYMLNRVIEVTGLGEFHIREMPSK